MYDDQQSAEYLEAVKQQNMKLEDASNQSQQQREQFQDEKQQQLDADQQRYKETTNEDGSMKPQHEIKDTKDFGVTENFQDLGNALTAGAQDAWNNTIDLGKYFDPEFHKQRTGDQDPYKFASSLKFNEQPIVRTGWGKFIRGATDIGIGFVGVGKIGTALKGVRGLSALSQASKVTNLAPKAQTALALGKTLGKGALKGAAVDAWDADSTDANLARILTDTDHSFFDVLEQLATTDYMSPAQRVGYNVLEGMALGGLLDLALEGVGAGIRKMSGQAADQERALKEAANKGRKREKLEPIDKAYPTPMTDVKLNLETEYVGRGEIIADAAQKKYEKDYFNALKKNNIVGDVSIDDWRSTWKTPSPNEIRNQLELSGYSADSVDDILDKIQPAWNELDDQVKAAYIDKQALDMDLDFGTQRDYSRRGIRQGKEVDRIGADQFEADLEFGQPRENPYYTYGAEAHENAPLSVDGDVMGAIRDQITIRNDLVSKRGANRGVMTEAAIRRVADGTDMSTDQINKMAEGLVDNESFKQLYGSTSKQQMRDDFIDATADVANYLDISGNSHLSDMDPERMLEFLHSLHPKFKDGQVMDSINGVDVLSHRQLVATDVMLGQLSQQIRDLSKAGLSISDQIDVTAPGNIIDGITERYKALARIRARTSALSSYNLRRFKSPNDAPIPNMESIYKEAENKAANVIDTLREVIRKDNDQGQLFEAWQYFNSASNGDLGTMKDMEAFFQRKLNGYSNGTVQERNAIVGEMMTMGINSMLSGPKTPVRATVGTALNTFMRPVSAIIGASLTGDTRTMRESWAFLGGMWEARGDAMRKASADFKTYLSKDDPFRGAIVNKKDLEWEQMSNYFLTNGTNGEKALYGIANTMRGLNRNPFLNYGPRVMSASDSFFGQLVGRGFERSKQHTKLYKSMESLQGSVDDASLTQLGFDADEAMEKAIWAADGKLADPMAQFSWDEAAMKGDLTGGMKKMEQALDAFPAIKPFVGLFMKTGINALELTTKYTPGLNVFLQETRDLLTKSWDDPDMVKYGIRSPQDLANHKAVMVGRQAIGTAVVGTASMMYLNGDLTGNGPPDRGLRTSWLQAGWKPRSIRIGGKYVSFDSLEPFNSFLAFVADVGDASNAMGEEWTNNEYSKAMYVLSANVVNKTFLAGLMNLQDLMSSKGQRSGSVAANLVNNQVPLSSLRNELGKLLSPGMRELEDGFAAGVYGRNLWFDLLPGSDQPSYRYDILNGNVLNDWDPMTRLWNAVAPFQSNLAANQTRQLLFRSQINLKQQFNRGPDGEDLDGYPDLKSRYQYLLGQQNIEGQLQDLFRKPQIVESIYKMEADRDAGKKYNTSNTLHGVEIGRIFNAAKTSAFQTLINEDQRALALSEQQRLQYAVNQQRKLGNNQQANDLQSIISIPK